MCYGKLICILVLYLIPFIAGLYIEDVGTRTVLFIFASVPQISFIYLEYLEYDSSTGFKDYFLDGYKSDFLMPIFFVGHMFLYYWIIVVGDDIPNKFQKNILYDVTTVICLIC